MEMFLGILLMLCADGREFNRCFFFRTFSIPSSDLFIHLQQTASPLSIVMGTRTPHLRKRVQTIHEIRLLLASPIQRNGLNPGDQANHDQSHQYLGPISSLNSMNFLWSMCRK